MFVIFIQFDDKLEKALGKTFDSIPMSQNLALSPKEYQPVLERFHQPRNFVAKAPKARSQRSQEPRNLPE